MASQGADRIIGRALERPGQLAWAFVVCALLVRVCGGSLVGRGALWSGGARVPPVVLTLGTMLSECSSASETPAGRVAFCHDRPPPPCHRHGSVGCSPRSRFTPDSRWFTVPEWDSGRGLSWSEAHPTRRRSATTSREDYGAWSRAGTRTCSLASLARGQRRIRERSARGSTRWVAEPTTRGSSGPTRCRTSRAPSCRRRRPAHRPPCSGRQRRAP